MKRLIINADDFGFTRDVNAGIIEAHRSGIVTSTTLMANGDAFAEAVRLTGETPTLDVGCHLVLVQGNSLISGRPLPAGPQDLLVALAQRKVDPYAEFRLQIEKIVDAGIRPTHLDTHKHTHLAPQVFRAVVRLAHEFEIPWVRLPLDATFRWSGLLRRFYTRLAAKYRVQMTEHFLGFRLTGSLNEGTLFEVLQHLRQGATELMCHPGYLGEELAAAPTRLKESRVLELEALTSSKIRRFLNESGVRLGPFSAATHP